MRKACTPITPRTCGIGPTAMFDNCGCRRRIRSFRRTCNCCSTRAAALTRGVVLDKLFSELGPRVSSFEYDVYQATLGLRGKVFAGWSTTRYLQIGANDQTETQSGNASTSRIEDLTFAEDGGVSICGGFNPFGIGSISAECAAYIAVDASNHASVDQTIVEASLSGHLRIAGR